MGRNEGVPLTNQSSDQTSDVRVQIKYGMELPKLLLTEHRCSYKYGASNEPSTKSTSEAIGGFQERETLKQPSWASNIYSIVNRG